MRSYDDLASSYWFNANCLTLISDFFYCGSRSMLQKQLDAESELNVPSFFFCFFCFYRRIFSVLLNLKPSFNIRYCNFGEQVSIYIDVCIKLCHPSSHLCLSRLHVVLQLLCMSCVVMLQPEFAIIDNLAARRSRRRCHRRAYRMIPPPCSRR